MLLRLQLNQLQRLTVIQLWQAIRKIIIIGVLCVLSFLVHFQKSIELEHRAGDAIVVVAIRLGDNFNRGLIKQRRHHLRRQKALPNQLVEFVLLLAQVAANFIRSKIHIRRTNSFMRVLRVFFALEHVGTCRQIFCAKFLSNVGARVGYSVRRDTCGIGSHICNQTDGALRANLHAFIETLRHAHRPLHVKAKFARCILLQLAGGKRRGGVLTPLLLFDGAHLPLCCF